MLGRLGVLAVVLLTVVAHRAFTLKKQFYPAVVFILNDNASLMVRVCVRAVARRN